MKPSQYRNTSLYPEIAGSVADQAMLPDVLADAFSARMTEKCADLIQELRDTGTISQTSEDAFLDSVMLCATEYAEKMAAAGCVDEIRRQDLCDDVIRNTWTLTQDTLERVQDIIEREDA